MSEAQSKEPLKIRVHERALAHLSRGLYRSPASALRELVSNAWDANANRVDIDTNHPLFYQLSIEDDGDGFERSDFENLMSGGIGNSLKRTHKQELQNGRPTIGRLGIGMLGIAQICGSFSISSRPRSGEPFKARVTLYDLAKAEMDQPDSHLIQEVTTDLGSEKIQGKIVEVGTYQFEEFDPSSMRFGTRIIADDVVPTFTEAFQASLKGSAFKPVPLDWGQAVKEILKDTPSLQLLGDYWRLVWELAATCPIAYLSEDAVPQGVVKNIDESLKSYDFSVFIDGRKLSKPIYLKGNAGGYTTRKIRKKTILVYGRPLTFEGYLCVQEGRQLRPDELRGVLIRIKNVGIGYYDASMLDFPDNQGPRSRWVTGEIYVSDGLEDALNIDRDSFNRFHPDFRALQTSVHEELRGHVFPTVYSKIQERTKVRQVKIASDRKAALAQAISKAPNSLGRVVVRSAAREKASLQPYSSSNRVAGTVDITIAEPETLPTKKSSQQLAHSILSIFEISMTEDDKHLQRKTFSAMLFDLLKKW